MVWLDPTRRKKRYSIDHGYTLLGFLPAENAELRVEYLDFQVDDSVSLYWLTSSDVVSLKELILQTSLRDARKERTSMIDEVRSSYLKLLKYDSESGETRKCLQMTFLY